MNMDLLKALRKSREDNLDLFTEYYCLAMDCKHEGNKDDYQYWIDRANDLCRENRKIVEDIMKISDGNYKL